MMTDQGTIDRDTARLAVATAVAGVGSAVALATFFAAGGPFGTLNDLGNAATGVLSGCLAWRLRGTLRGGAGPAAAALAIGGAAVTVVGSGLVISGTPYFLAGLVSSVGFAGIGAWLVALARGSDAVPGRLRRLGVVAGALMAAGILALPGIPMGIDDPATAPAWIWLASIGWLGIYVVYPAWALQLGRDALRDRAVVAATTG